MTGLSIRPLTLDDAMVLLEWRNDEDTRRWSRTRQVISVTDHEAWLADTLADPRRLFLLLLDDETPVAAVRYDVGSDESQTAEISVLVASWSRGKGIGSTALERAEGVLRSARPATSRIVAVVHEANAASVRLFESAGFVLDHASEPWLTYRREL